MLKRISYLLLALLILVSTVGITVSRHYCGNTLKSVSIILTPKPCCDMPLCCHDETLFLKIKDDFSVVSFPFDFSQHALDLPAKIELEHFNIPENELFSSTLQTPPPPNIGHFLDLTQNFRL
jgi:hypothetical protein